MGTVVETLPKETNKEWEWFKFSSSIKPHFIPDGYGTYELVVEVWRSVLQYPFIFRWIVDTFIPSPRRIIGCAFKTPK